MKYKLLAVSMNSQVNIGDYIQALASSQFLPQIDDFIQREELKKYDGEECKVIMNGWYMHNPKQWPPSSKIHPLYVAVHFNTSAKEILFSKESINYLKQFEPIGCRDTYTRDLLLKQGIDAYFSGCMTLTLGYKYQTKEKEDKCYFVDPYFITHWNLSSFFSNLIYLVFHWKPINIIAHKYPETKKGLRKRMILTTFYRKYKRYFTKETLINAEYICQQSNYYKDNFSSDEARLEEAEKLVKKYAKARLVVTSRIHCALPCLGLETPVIYTIDGNQSEVSACRLGGLQELFNIFEWNQNHLIPQFSVKEKFSIKKTPKNKDLWKSYASHLNRICKQFIDVKQIHL
ncbi:polysaccharide pyruvyl transferase family protein [Bacteroides clarus]|uniref:polysaccharide pyruvyl transferase family protein n=1 Tax=Bacteroides clarus TaxID=626929 RepID=UPI00189B247F|nr:polysaccharide pyruvyl transferase family protein [Bacteroides clarus]